ncbi:lipoprotein signal peptidase [Aureimonas endophytica]|uniref:Lipoprotein signal peptidase n=1 Tax=Aureimonas endophytica TaxID=2027858 RepID=A0A917A193_9HYPH|nr:signal peptidase II [Aureimonas endophytica]GGE21746.1 lipoprotein signal peptidase [Aureimonas endophytica]
MTRRPVLVGLLVAALAVALDQVVKAIVVATMPLGSAIDLLPFLALYHARNEGIAFSMFSGLGDLSLALLAGLVLVFVGALWWKTPVDRRLSHFAFAIIVGGAIGNLVDRLRLGYVVDYVFFHTPVWSFAVFNLADAFISVGAVLILVDEFVLARKPAEAAGSRD